jgi:hypothetical protein
MRSFGVEGKKSEGSFKLETVRRWGMEAEYGFGF